LSTWGERHRRLLARVMIALALSLVVDAVGAGLVWYFEHGVKRWDIAALIPIVEGAGGVITNWDGAPWRDGETVLACGDKRVHETAIKLLKS